MRKITYGLLFAGAAMTIAGCNREEPAPEANTAVVEETEVPPSESADNLDNAADNLDNAADNMTNSTADNAVTGNADDLGSTDH